MSNSEHTHKSGGAGRYAAALLVFAAAVFFDQITKRAAVNALYGGRSIVLIPGVLKLTYVENRGAAFGIMQNGTVFFSVVACAAILILAYIYGRIPRGKRYLPLQAAAVLIAAGAAGNLIDRLLLGYVRDFIYFCLIDFPVFNAADIYVTVCTFGTAFLVLFYYKEEELDVLFPSSSK